MPKAKNPKYNYREYPAKHYMSVPGICRWCNNDILDSTGQINKKRNWCNQACVTHYLLRADPKMMRQHVFFRDKGRCEECGTVWRYMSDPWEADHILPLVMAFGDLSYWEPTNVRILCKDPCHKAKTKEDNAFLKPAARRYRCEE